MIIFECPKITNSFLNTLRLQENKGFGILFFDGTGFKFSGKPLKVISI
jgi:hypothetical protein